MERAGKQDKHGPKGLDVLEREAENKFVLNKTSSCKCISTYPSNEDRLRPSVLLNYKELVPEPAPPVARARPPIFRLRDPLCAVPRPLEKNPTDTCLQMEVRKACVLL